MDETIIITSKLLLAVLIPLVGSIFVMLLDKDENLRETVSSVSSIALFIVVCSMIPTIFAGKTLYYNLFTLLPNVTISLRADPMSMIFAMVASSLWTIAVFYSMGYMRGLNEHAQTRFNACFA
ncbi:MAG: monovalent cation/H+ antiporter subunit D family protein, partial [Desulfobulbia bacterium]